MTTIKLKDRLTYILLVSNFLVIGSAFFSYIGFNYTFDQFLELMYIIIPLFSAYIVTVIKHYLEKGDRKVENPIYISKPIVIFSQLLPILYAIYMMSILISGDGSTINFKHTKQLIGLGEIIFGTYLGLIISTLYSQQSTKDA